MEKIKSVLGKIYNKNVKFFDLGIIVVILSLFLLILGQEVGYLTVGNLLEKTILADETGFWSITYMYASFNGIWLVVVL